MRWHVHDRRQVYGSEWVDVWIDDVELPGGRRIAHHVLTFPRQSVIAVVVDGRERVLLIWRHRHITDAWGWEVLAGWADPGEDLAATAAQAHDAVLVHHDRDFDDIATVATGLRTRWIVSPQPGTP
jgi:hypothetical protein